MTDTAQLQPSELSRILVSLQEQFDWHPRSEVFDLLELWRRDRSGSAFYHMTGRPDGQAVILKAVDDWSADDAKRMFHAMTDLADILAESGIDGAFAIRPVAWTGDPALVVMPYVKGTDVVSILRTPEHSAWRGDLLSWMTKAGEMLAVYHLRHRHSGEEDLRIVFDLPRRLGTRFRIKASAIEWMLSGIDPKRRRARSYGDIGPGNLHAAENGDIYLLDPPDETPVALVHRDLGNFVFELRRQLAGRGFTRSRPVQGQFDRLRLAFLDGYSRRSHGGPLGSVDEALMALFEMRRAVGMARKRLPSRPGDALWFARSALARRRDVLAEFKRTRSKAGMI